MSMPSQIPDAFRHAYNENCSERQLFNEQLLTQAEYWEIWSAMNEYVTVRSKS
jgi:hypothetical protein